MRVRFAPSPTGTLHIGSARTALYNFLFARHTGGAFVLRIDDTDAARSDAALERSIMADLRWLGLEWDEGPDTGGPFGPYRQSERLERHRAAADELLAAGLAYRCFCPEERLEELRREALAAGRTPRYDRRCLALPADEVRRRLDAGEPAAVRFKVPAGEVVVDDLIRGRVVIGADALSDPIIVRSDGVAGYNFATVVDDRDMRITHVIRGDDHLTNTARQQLLFQALGGPVPRLGAPLHGARAGRRQAQQAPRRDGRGRLPRPRLPAGGHRELPGAARLVARRGRGARARPPGARVRPRPALAEPGGVRPRQARLARPRAHHGARAGGPRAPLRGAAAGRDAAAGGGRARGRVPAVAGALRRRAGRGGGGADAARRRRTSSARSRSPPCPSSRACARCAREAPEWLTPAGARELLAAYRAWGKERGIGARDLLMPLRVALTSAEHGPELPFVLAALDRETALARLDLILAGNAAGEPTSTPGDQP